MYYLTGVQHTKSGDVAIPVLGFEKEDGYLQKYHHEMDYAMSVDSFLGLYIIVFDGSGNIVLKDNWIKAIEPAPQPVIEESVEE